MFSIIPKVGFDSLSLTGALAVSEVIERTAPGVIHAYADFVSKWQVMFQRPTQKLNRIYLDEHNLTEGKDHGAQHICLVDELMQPYQAELKSLAYQDEQNRFNCLCMDHFENVYQKIIAILN